MQCSNSIAGCSEIEPRSFDDIYNECKCYEQCGFGGPSVCGSDGILYLNKCRMQVAACEKEMDIKSNNKSFCNMGKTIFLNHLDI